MSTSKKINKICISVISIVLALTILFMNGESIGLVVAARAVKYESTLFDTSYVHQIDIVMDDWDSFIESCEDEEYSACTVVIDGEKHSNIAIRAKGNTSLSNVKSLGSERYSFKLEFDHYEDAKTLDGLDKLCLNNLIQDNTMMKDYIVYQMMKDFGVDSPLCSFAYLTVNGEDWGLYLAVEGIEDSFLSRNYGSETGELYKPDSLSFGGGRGNGKEFSMDDFDFEDFNAEDFDMPEGFNSEDFTPGNFNPFGENQQNSQSETDSSAQITKTAAGQMPTMPSGDQSGQTPTMPSGNQSGQTPTMPGGDQSGQMPTMPSGDQSGQMPTMPSGDQNGQTPTMPGGDQNGQMPTMPEGNNQQQNGGGMGSDDVKLKYIDDDPDSYSNIFDNAKTDVSTADENRLINSLKKLSSYEDLEDVLDMDEVLRYFVVHNFVCNGDSYTGSMIHNYYLHESDGKLGMIPWDYNLAFGTFQGGDASGTVNTDIDSPVSGGNMDDRPMVGWIFSDEEYTEQYHALFDEFIEKWFTNGELETLIADTAELIRPYVEKDPTKFCTLEEFDTGVEALAQFVTLRGEAVSRQLSGDDTAVETGTLNLSDMGTMGNTMGGGQSKPSDGENNAQKPEDSGNSTSDTAPDNNGNSASDTTPDNNGNNAPDAQKNTDGSVNPQSGTADSQDNTSDTTDKAGTDGSQFPSRGQMGEMPNAMPDGSDFSQIPNASTVSQDANAWILICVSVLILGAGLFAAVKMKY